MMYQMNRVNHPMDHMPEEVLLRAMMGVNGPHRPNPMRVDVQETADSYILEAELPGVKLADVTLTVENDVLTIGAKRAMRTREEREKMVMHERRGFPRVERRFALEGIEQEGIAAAMADGILTVTLPKEKPEGRKALRHIPINAPVAEVVPVLEAGTDAPAEE